MRPKLRPWLLQELVRFFLLHLPDWLAKLLRWLLG
jgi:hypothetical protein